MKSFFSFREKLSFAVFSLFCCGLIYQFSITLWTTGQFNSYREQASDNEDRDFLSFTAKSGKYHAKATRKTENISHTTTRIMDVMNISLDSFLSVDYNLTEKQWLALMEARQKSRTDRMNFYCDSYRIRKRTTNELLAKQSYRHALYANDQHKIIFSLVLKVASNHFKKSLKQFGGIKRLFNIPPESCKGRLENYYKILFVRHPLARMLSAYIDKFVEHHIFHFVHIGRRIIKTQRKSAKPMEIKQATDVTFPEFIKYLTIGPSTRSNAHWDLVWIHNRVCQLRYDFIGKMETIADDYMYMVYKMSHGKLNPFNYQLMRAYRNYNGNYKKQKEYYNNVSLPILRQWYKIYRRDFELFGYEVSNLCPSCI